MFHVVFGAGQVGSSLARLLASRGHRVRVVRRSDAPVGPGIEVLAGDARDPAFVLEATRGAHAVYHCINPSAYTKAAWSAEFPAFGAALIDAAIANEARLVCLDNLYAYGPTDDARTPDSPMRPSGVKGSVRADWDAALRDAAATRGLRFVAGRAGDFFGPGALDQSLLSMNAVRGLAAGRMVWLIGDAKASHAFSYVPDVVDALAAFGEAGPDVEGRVYHFPIHQLTPAQLVSHIAEALGVRPRWAALPPWLIGLLGVVLPFFGELGETLYQWDRPFLADDAAFRARFPGLGRSTPSAAREIAAALA